MQTVKTAQRGRKLFNSLSWQYLVPNATKAQEIVYNDLAMRNIEYAISAGTKLAAQVDFFGELVQPATIQLKLKYVTTQGHAVYGNTVDVYQYVFDGEFTANAEEDNMPTEVEFVTEEDVAANYNLAIDKLQTALESNDTTRFLAIPITSAFKAENNVAGLFATMKTYNVIKSKRSTVKPAELPYSLFVVSGRNGRLDAKIAKSSIADVVADYKKFIIDETSA